MTMEQNNLIAYNSKIQPLIFVLTSAILVPICYFAVQSEMQYTLLLILLFSSVIAVLLAVAIYLFSLPAISFEVKNQKLYIYQHSKETIIPLSEITQVDLCENSFSFDARIYYTDCKKGLHRMIENKGTVCKAFVELLARNNIPVRFYTMG